MANDVSARDLVNKIWDEVAAARAVRPPPTAVLADHGRLVEDAERHYVNSHYVLCRAPRDSGFEPEGKESPLKRRLRARAARFVVHTLGGYFDDEQEFLVHLVRLQNTITANLDRLSDEIRQLEAMMQDESALLRAADTTLHGRLEDRIRALEEELATVRQSGGTPA